MTHDEAKQLIDAYYNKAKQLYKYSDTVRIASIKNVQLIIPGGAFVEAMVWISEEELKDE